MVCAKLPSGFLMRWLSIWRERSRHSLVFSGASARLVRSPSAPMSKTMGGRSLAKCTNLWRSVRRTAKLASSVAIPSWVCQTVGSIGWPKSYSEKLWAGEAVSMWVRKGKRLWPSILCGTSTSIRVRRDGVTSIDWVIVFTVLPCVKGWPGSRMIRGT